MPISNGYTKRRRFYILAALAAIIAIASFASPAVIAQEKKTAGPPPTRTDNVKDVLHGVEIVDPYRWLEDQWSKETRAWIDAQNTYTDSIMKGLPQCERFKPILAKLMKVDALGMPAIRGGRYFYSKRLADQDLAVVYMREGRDGEEQVLIDPHPMSPDHTTSVRLYGISKDGKLVLYGVREGGADEVEIRFFAVDTKTDLPEKLARARYYGVSLLPDKSGYYYVRRDKEGPRLYYRNMGDAPGTETYIYGKHVTPEKFLGCGISESGKFLLISVTIGWTRNEIYIKDLSTDGEIKTVVKDLDGLFYSQFAGDDLYIWTNWEAPNGRVIKIDPANPAAENWKEIAPERDYTLQGFSLAGGKLFLRYLEDVISRLEICNPDGEILGKISMPGIGTVSGMGGRWDSNEAFYAFSSFNVPYTIFSYDVATGDQGVWYKSPIPFESDKFEVKQVFYSSKDGTKVPMFIVQPKGITLDGQNPTMLTGYGGFNSSLTPGFSTRTAAWIEAGGVFAVPNMRGGGEYGEAWHRAGKLEKKQNVFDDFIAAAEYLIREKYTSPAKLGIIGGSNGGLLVGACMTQRPDLYAAVVCTYPLLDMVRYHKFLVGSTWVSEYGSADNPNQFKYIYAYSPYHHAKKGEKYPPVLFITGDADTRVAPLHARKMTALLQASIGSDEPVMLRYHTKAGHSGGQPISVQIDYNAEYLGFLMWQMGEK